MKINARIIHIANDHQLKKEKLVGGKNFDLVLETMSGPKRHIALQIILRPFETFVPFGIHVGQEHALTYKHKTKEVVCRIKPSYSRYLSKKYHRKFNPISKQLNSYEKEIFEGRLVVCSAHLLKHFNLNQPPLQHCKK